MDGVGLTVLPAMNSMIPEIYWQMPPKKIIVPMITFGVVTPAGLTPNSETRKMLVPKARRPSGAGLAKLRGT